MSHADYMRTWRARRKPQPVPNLDWPVNLFGHPIAIEDLVRNQDYAPAKIGRVPKMAEGDVCAWDGCNNAHRQRFACRAEHSQYGGGFTARKYCCSDGCLTLYYRKRASAA